MIGDARAQKLFVVLASFSVVNTVGTLNYIYKMAPALALIPLLHIARGLIRGYLGQAQSERMMEAAASA